MKTSKTIRAGAATGIAKAYLWIGFSFAAILVASAGPAWLTLPIMVAYAAAVL